MRGDRVRRAGLVEEREQFRVLFRTFLRRLFHSDLVPETVDLRQSAIVLAAVLTVPPALYAVALSLNYGSWMSDMQLATRAVPQKLYFIGYSMAAVGLVTVLAWDALFPDRRDAMVLGGLPIRPRTVALAKLAALAAFIAGFAIVVNAPATVIFSFVAGGYLPFEAFLRYPAAHLAATVSAGLLVFLALVAVQASLVLVCPRRLHPRLSMLAQLLFVIVLIEWFAFAPGLLVRLAAIDQAVTNEALMAAGGPYRFIGLMTSEAGIWLPPVWFLGLYEVVWGFDPDVYRGLAATSLAAFRGRPGARGSGLRRRPPTHDAADAGDAPGPPATGRRPVARGGAPRARDPRARPRGAGRGGVRRRERGAQPAPPADRRRLRRPRAGVRHRLVPEPVHRHRRGRAGRAALRALGAPALDSPSFSRSFSSPRSASCSRCPRRSARTGSSA